MSSRNLSLKSVISAYVYKSKMATSDEVKVFISRGREISVNPQKYVMNIGKV